MSKLVGATVVFPEVALTDKLFDLSKLIVSGDLGGSLRVLHQLAISMSEGAIIGTPEGRMWASRALELLDAGLRDFDTLHPDGREKARFRDHSEHLRTTWAHLFATAVQPRNQSGQTEPAPDWATQIIRAHAELPFDYIYSTEEEAGTNSEGDGLQGAFKNLFSFPSPRLAGPQSQEVAPDTEDPYEPVKTFLSRQSKLTLIDPHIFKNIPDEHPKRLWDRSMAFLGGHAREGVSLREVDIHSNQWWERNERSPNDIHFQARVLPKLKEWFGNEVKFTAYIWRRSREFHDRAVLGNRLGFEPIAGLDLIERATTLRPLTEKICHSLRIKFDKNSDAFDLIRTYGRGRT
ncbi:MAG: hypothetical protein CMM48_15545 [Rhodospirillaceae bacterium]|nr:hypothetical protein [Rhodospirillaceae bacterium]